MPKQNAPKKRLVSSEINRLDYVKRLAIVAMFSDDELMNHFVVKGGAAIDLIYQIAGRASVDVDLSLPSDLPFTIHEAVTRIERSLSTTFALEGLSVFDVVMKEVPAFVSQELLPFWGGYQVDFKLIEASKRVALEGNAEALRRNALQIGQKGKFSIDISKHEYCEPKASLDLQGFRVYVYTPEMIVAEKLRAICQQTLEYSQFIHRPHRSPRAKDFGDIYLLVDHFELNMSSIANQELISLVFAAKRVPLILLKNLESQRDFHRAGFPSVQATVKAGSKLMDFDFYFDCVVDLVSSLEALWHIQPPGA